MRANVHCLAAAGLLIIMFFLAGGAALHESATVDEVAHVGAGLSYLQRLDLRLNPEHPPLGKALAALPLAIRRAHADYSGAAWKLSVDFFPAYGIQWIFGDAVLGRWNDWKSTLMWARFPMIKHERKAWRIARWGCVLRGVLWAALFVYVVYFILSWNQPDDALNRVGSGQWASLIRRPLMPLWLYCRGLLLMLLTGSRPTYLFGHAYPDGVPFYFPVVFALKSSLGFLLLLLLAAVVGIICRK